MAFHKVPQLIVGTTGSMHRVQLTVVLKIGFQRAENYGEL